jgi:hypothetical protein
LPSVLPPDQLRSGERVLIEQKPHVRAYVTVGLLVYLAVGTALWLLLTALGAVVGGVVGGVVAGVLLFLILPLPALILTYRASRQWRSAWYALTNQRVIVAGSGLSAFQQATTDFPLRVPPGSQTAGVTLYRVKQISVIQGYFGQRMGFGNIVFLADPSSFVWKGVMDPAKVRGQLEAEFNAVQESGYISRAAQEKFAQQVAGAYGQMQEPLAITVASTLPPPAGIDPTLIPAAAAGARGPGSVRPPPPTAAGADPVTRPTPVFVRCPYCKTVYDETAAGKCPQCGATF